MHLHRIKSTLLLSDHSLLSTVVLHDRQTKPACNTISCGECIFTVNRQPAYCPTIQHYPVLKRKMVNHVVASKHTVHKINSKFTAHLNHNTQPVNLKGFRGLVNSLKSYAKSGIVSQGLKFPGGHCLHCPGLGLGAPSKVSQRL